MRTETERLLICQNGLNVCSFGFAGLDISTSYPLFDQHDQIPRSITGTSLGGGGAIFMGGGLFNLISVAFDFSSLGCGEKGWPPPPRTPWA